VQIDQICACWSALSRSRPAGEVLGLAGAGGSGSPDEVAPAIAWLLTAGQLRDRRSAPRGRWPL